MIINRAATPASDRSQAEAVLGLIADIFELSNQVPLVRLWLRSRLRLGFSLTLRLGLLLAFNLISA